MIAFNKRNITGLLAIFLFGLIGCSEEFIPDTSDTEQLYVVEGYIEAGEGSLPAFVTLTKSVPFLSTIDLNTFNTLFVNEAVVTVNDGSKTVELTELCLNDLPEPLREQAAVLLGFNPDSLTLNFCAYVDINDELDRQFMGTYDLRIEVEDEVITSSTTIPELIPLTNFRWDDPPGVPSDTIAALFVTIDDPEEKNFYRYFTEENDGGLIAPFSSVTNDNLLNGQEFEFPLTKAEPMDGDFDPETFGFYYRGDSIRIKWMCIDEAHFDFWNTLEFARNNTGPFSSYNRVSSNVDGALGIWGGYAVEYYEDVVPE